MTTSHETIAIVTGASRGLGFASARRLASDGCHVIIDARDANQLDIAASQMEGSVETLAGDVSDPEHRGELIRTAVRAGGLDLLINNASLLGPSPQPTLENYPLDTLREVYEVNVLAPLALIQASLPLIRQRRGVIINVTSDAAREPYQGWGGYGSSKAALDQITNILVAEEPDVSVYGYDPGDMNTQMHQAAFPDEDISDRPPPENSVQALMALIEGRPASGAYHVGDVLLTA